MFTQLEKFNEAKKLFKELTPELKELLIYNLLYSKDIDYTQISNMYVKTLEAEREDKNAMINEAGCCIMEHIIDHEFTPNSRRKKKELVFSEEQKKHIQRSLYFLNQTKMFNMETTNETFGYDEEEAKKLSWYERQKENGY